jgi:hypothetical protein
VTVIKGAPSRAFCERAGPERRNRSVSGSTTSTASLDWTIRDRNSFCDRSASRPGRFLPDLRSENARRRCPSRPGTHIAFRIASLSPASTHLPFPSRRLQKTPGVTVSQTPRQSDPLSSVTGSSERRGSRSRSGSCGPHQDHLFQPFNRLLKFLQPHRTSPEPVSQPTNRDSRRPETMPARRCREAMLEREQLE